MIFTVDIGNTSTFCGIFDTESGKLLSTFRFKTFQFVSSEELYAFLKNFFDIYKINPEKIEQISISSVVPSVLKTWVGLGKNWFKDKVFVAKVDNVPIKIALRNPKEVGADRIVNAFAGWKKYKRDLIIADFGTAITFDCVSGKGVYLGGAISPGVILSAESLFKKAAKLSKIEFEAPPEENLGRDTENALKIGILYGFAGLTDRIVEILKKEMEKEGLFPKVIATGGLARLVYPYSKTLEEIDETLILKGLFWLAKEKQAKNRVGSK